jgi:isopentenyl diphosphate isomerase/L-lactate dehydrogenase-like FMN-dependent dehydrogenase
VLPEIADAVGGRAEIVFDGGIRRGGDIVKALALGANACIIGRAFLYGLGARGEEGVERALDILLSEMDRAMALLGRPTIADLDRTAVNMTRLYSDA